MAAYDLMCNAVQPEAEAKLGLTEAKADTFWQAAEALDECFEAQKAQHAADMERCKADIKAYMAAQQAQHAEELKRLTSQRDSAFLIVAALLSADPAPTQGPQLVDAHAPQQPADPHEVRPTAQCTIVCEPA